MKSPSNQRQQGAALLMMMLALIAISSALAYQFLGEMNQKLKRQSAQEIGVALEEAKQNLLAFAASIPELYPTSCGGAPCGVGFFPTPDVSNTGGPAGNTSAILGRLPSRQSGGNYFFFHPRDKSSSGWLDTPFSIWYALPFTMGVSPNTLNIQADSNLSSKKPLNSTTLKTFLDANKAALCSGTTNGICLDANGSGTASSIDSVVALLIYTGTPLTNQTGRPSNSATDYLEFENADGDNLFSKQIPQGQSCSSQKIEDCFNDRVLAITYEDWVNAMLPKVLPYCSATNKPAWFTSNNWSVICP